jgi:integrase
MGVKIRQPNKGRGHPWYVYINHDGKRRSVKAGAKETAQKLKKRFEGELAAGKFNLNTGVYSNVPTFEKYSEKFMRTYSKQNHKAATRKSFRQVLDRYLLPEFGTMHLDEIKLQHVKAFLEKLFETDKAEGHGEGKLSVSTIKVIKAYFSSIMTEARWDGHIEANPAAKTGRLFKGKQAKEKKVDFFTWEEVKLFEAAVKKHMPRYWPFFLTALRTGMRLGELMALKPGDLDFVNGYITVERTFSGGRITTPKSKKTRRVYLTGELVEILDRQVSVKRKEEKLKKKWKELPEWLFYSEAGTALDVNNLRKQVFYRILEKAKLRRIKFHALRHTYASLRIAAGHNIKDIQEQLGHHSITITMDTYGHLMEGEHRDQVAQLDMAEAPNGNGKVVNGND